MRTPLGSGWAVLLPQTRPHEKEGSLSDPSLLLSRTCGSRRYTTRCSRITLGCRRGSWRRRWRIVRRSGRIVHGTGICLMHVDSLIASGDCAASVSTRIYATVGRRCDTSRWRRSASWRIRWRRGSRWHRGRAYRCALQGSAKIRAQIRKCRECRRQHRPDHDCQDCCAHTCVLGVHNCFIASAPCMRLVPSILARRPGELPGVVEDSHKPRQMLQAERAQ